MARVTSRFARPPAGRTGSVRGRPRPRRFVVLGTALFCSAIAAWPAGGAECGHPVFGSRRNYTTSSNQNSRYLRFGDTVSVLRNAGDGSFEPRAVLQVGEGPRGLALRDPDGDGDLDVAVLETLDALSVVMGQCDGSGIFSDGFESGDASAWAGQMP